MSETKRLTASEIANRALLRMEEHLANRPWIEQPDGSFKELPISDQEREHYEQYCAMRDDISKNPTLEEARKDLAAYGTGVVAYDKDGEARVVPMLNFTFAGTGKNGWNPQSGPQKIMMDADNKPYGETLTDAVFIVGDVVSIRIDGKHASEARAGLRTIARLLEGKDDATSKRLVDMCDAADEEDV